MIDVELYIDDCSLWRRKDDDRLALGYEITAYCLSLQARAAKAEALCDDAAILILRCPRP